MDEKTVLSLEALVVRDGELHIRQVSANVANVFEDVLGDADIMVPDDDREGNEDEACFYGCTYSDFEDGITEELAKIVAGVRANGADITAAKETISASFVELLAAHNIAVPGNKDDIFQRMDGYIAAMLSIVAKHQNVPVNDWEY